MEPSPSVPQTFQRFFSIIQERVGDTEKLNGHKAALTSVDYETELSILKPHFQPFVWGIGTTLALFASFRISKFTGALKMSKTGGGYEFKNLKKGSSLKQREPEQQLSDAFSIPADIFLSLIVGASAAVFLTDITRIEQDLAAIPLVKGRSLVAEELCTDFIKEYNNLPMDLWKSKDAMESSSIKAIQLFIDNCQKRDRLVSYREQHHQHSHGNENGNAMGIARKDATNIPSPGVQFHLDAYSQEQ